MVYALRCLRLLDSLKDSMRGEVEVNCRIALPLWRGRLRRVLISATDFDSEHAGAAGYRFDVTASSKLGRRNKHSA